MISYHNALKLKNWLKIYGKKKKNYFYEKYFGFSILDIFKNVHFKEFLKTLQIKRFFLTEKKQGK